MDQRDVLRFLPEVFRGTIWPKSPLEGVIESMVTLLDPVDRRMSALDQYFDPFRAPTAMLPYLASWVDLGWLAVLERADGDGIPPDRLRRLIALAPFFAKHRGTAIGLETMLRTATGHQGITVADGVTDPSIRRPFHLVVRIPAEARSQSRLVERIVRSEKPIHLTHAVEVAGEPG